MYTSTCELNDCDHSAEMIDANDDAMISIDLTGAITSWNYAAGRIFGYSESEAIGSQVAMLIAPERPGEKDEILDRIRSGHGISHYQTVGRRKDGILCNILISVLPQFDVEGEIIGASSIARDITRSKRSEITSSVLAAIIESSNDAIISKDLNSIITTWNTGASRLFGYSADEAIGQPVTMLIPPDRRDEEPGILSRIRRGERIEHYETIRRRKDGSLIDISLTVSPLFDARGRVFGASKIARDISYRKNAERELELSNAKLAEFSRRMSRDLRAATVIQRTFVPHGDLKFEPIDFAWAFRPCDELAGDGLNIIPFDDGKFGLYVLDVCGHGVAPALLSVAMSRILLRHTSGNGSGKGNLFCEAQPSSSPTPAAIAALLTELFPFDSASQQFATMTYGMLDPATGEFRYITAGHPGPVVIPSQGERFLAEATGFPIGIGDGVYEEYLLKLQKHDRLYLYSDGVVEVPNDDAEQFGKERLLNSLKRNRSSGLQASIDSLIQDLVEWQGSDRFPDDISILAVEYLNNSSAAIATK